jgi:hypothetical protein
MADARVDDLLSLDRDVAKAWKALARWRTKLARDPEAHADEDPIEPVRRAAGKSTWDALRGLTPPAAEVPLRDALVPWVGVLTLARLGREDDVAWARAAAKERARFAGDPPRLVSWRQAWRGVVTARTTGDATQWLAAAADVGEELASLGHERAERRVEVARRLGLEHPWELCGVGPAPAIRAAARRWLDATEDLARATWKDARGDEGGAAAVLQGALGREATEGWPAHLTRRWLEEGFAGALAGLTLELPPLPAALGAASFLRALGDLGFAARVAAAPAAMPFAVAREPGSRAAHRLGFVLAALPVEPEWQVRALGLGRRAALRQCRVLARTALLEARLDAARVLLAPEGGNVPEDRFAELTERLFGAPLDARLRGAWPGARDDEAARFVALVEAHPMTEELRNRFDVDWFRNPRAWAHVRAVSAAPAREPHDAKALDAGVETLARAFEGALG